MADVYIKGTGSPDFVINKGNTDAAVDMSVKFERGSTGTDAEIAWDETSDEFNFNFPIQTKGPLHDVKAYGAVGDGSTDDSAAFIAAIAAAAGGTVFIPMAATSYKLSADVTVPVGVTVRFTQGALLSIDSAKTFTINGSLEAELYQIFSGDGSVSLSAGSVVEVYPQWWGAVGDGSNDDTTAIQAAMTAATASSGVVLFPIGTYKTTSTLVVGDGVILRGVTHRLYGEEGSKIHYTGTGFAVELNDASGVEYMNILSADDGIAFYGIGASVKESIIYGANAAGSIGVQFSDGTLTNPAYYCRLEGCRVRKFKTLLKFSRYANANWVWGTHLLNTAGDGHADYGIHIDGANGNELFCDLEGTIDTKAVYITGSASVSCLGNRIHFVYYEVLSNPEIMFGQSASANIVTIGNARQTPAQVEYEHHTAGRNKVLAMNKYQQIPTSFETTTGNNLLDNTNLEYGSANETPTGWSKYSGAGGAFEDEEATIYGYRSSSVTGISAHFGIKYTLPADVLEKVKGKVITASMLLRCDWSSGSPSACPNMRIYQDGVATSTYGSYHTTADVTWEELVVTSYIDPSATNVHIRLYSNNPGINPWSFRFAIPMCVLGTEIWDMTPRYLTEAETDLSLWHTSPEIALHNTTEEDTDGGRENTLTFVGEQSGGERSTLAAMEVSHDGTSDDEKGKVEISVNDGNDGDSPSVVAVKIISDGGVFMASLKSGVDQATAGAAAGELWVDTNDGNTIKLGT